MFYWNKTGLKNTNNAIFSCMQPSSKVIVMDEDGSQSKAVARALHRFGIKVCPPSTCDSCILKCVIYKICSHSTDLLDGSRWGWNSIWCNLQNTSDTPHTSFADVHLCLKQTVCLVGNSEFGWIITETLPNGWGLPSLECIRAANKTWGHRNCNHYSEGGEAFTYMLCVH